MKAPRSDLRSPLQGGGAGAPVQPDARLPPKRPVDVAVAASGNGGNRSGRGSARPGAPEADLDEPARHLARARRRERVARAALPIVVVVALLALWEGVVAANRIPPQILPAPSRVAEALVRNWGTLAPALWSTAQLTLLALGGAFVGGVLLAIGLALSDWVEAGLAPIALMLRVTPIVAIAPLVLVYVDDTMAALLLCASLAAVIPIVAHAVIGLKAADRHLGDLYALYGATTWQRIRFLLAPSALPHLLGGLKAAAGLALAGAMVAELAAGAAGRPQGLASHMLESMQRSELPTMFAALLLASLLGIFIVVVFTALERLLVGHWHRGELRRVR